MKSFWRIMIGIILFFTGVTVYTIWDNNRVVVVNETIYIDDLPEELQEFRILQITDLHEQEFGDGQENLIDMLNELDYDMAVFTGDMLDDEQSVNYKPTYSLLDGMNNLNDALFVPGNTDPQNSYTEPTYAREKHEFINGMEERGLKKLDSVYTLRRGNAEIHFVEFALSLVDTQAKLENFSETNSGDSEDDKYLRSLYEDMSILDNLTEQDILISLYHYPLVDMRIDILKDDSSMFFRNYDLHIAGHYHGGQIRLPFYGALIVPEAYYENIFFPPRDRVNGLWEYDGLKQYVSKGLGSSSAISFLNFRLFNTPEINLLTLERTPN